MTDVHGRQNDPQALSLPEDPTDVTIELLLEHRRVCTQLLDGACLLRQPHGRLRKAEEPECSERDSPGGDYRRAAADAPIEFLESLLYPLLAAFGGL